MKVITKILLLLMIIVSFGSCIVVAPYPHHYTHYHHYHHYHHYPHHHHYYR